MPDGVKNTALAMVYMTKDTTNRHSAIHIYKKKALVLKGFGIILKIMKFYKLPFFSSSYGDYH
jgi:hypothetical protein